MSFLLLAGHSFLLQVHCFSADVTHFFSAKMAQPSETQQHERSVENACQKYCQTERTECPVEGQRQTYIYIYIYMYTYIRIIVSIHMCISVIIIIIISAKQHFCNECPSTGRVQLFRKALFKPINIYIYKHTCVCIYINIYIYIYIHTQTHQRNSRVGQHFNDECPVVQGNVQVTIGRAPQEQKLIIMFLNVGIIIIIQSLLSA